MEPCVTSQVATPLVKMPNVIVLGQTVTSIYGDLPENGASHIPPFEARSP